MDFLYSNPIVIDFKGVMQVLMNTYKINMQSFMQLNTKLFILPMLKLACIRTFIEHKQQSQCKHHSLKQTNILKKTHPHQNYYKTI